MATLGTVVYQKGTEHVDQIYDIDLAATLTVIRELVAAAGRPSGYSSHIRSLPMLSFIAASSRRNAASIRSVLPCCFRL
jgi:hypothetical protein